MTLRGDIMSFVTDTFAGSIVNNDHMNDMKTFAKKAAKFIMDYPHEENGTYGCYIIMFLNLIKIADDKISNANLIRIAHAISGEMKRVLEYDSNNSKLTDKEVYDKIKDISVRLTVQQCSKNVHYKLSLIDQSAKKASLQLGIIEKLAEEEAEADRKEKASKMQAIFNAKFNNPALGNATQMRTIESKKRKIEEVDVDEKQNGNGPEKVQRVYNPPASTFPSGPSSKDLLGIITFTE